MIEIIIHAAHYYGINPALLLAICTVESDLRNVVNVRDGSHRSSYGICQIQLRTARSHYMGATASDLLKPEINA